MINAEDDRSSPTRQEVKTLLHHMQSLLIDYDLSPPSLQTGDERWKMVCDLVLIEGGASAPSFYTEQPGSHSVTVRNWPGGMSETLEKIRTVSRAIMTRWGLTRYRDLPPYPNQPENGARAGNLTPDFPLVIDDVERYVLSNAAEILRRNLERVLSSPSTESPSEVRPLLGTHDESGLNDPKPIYRKILEACDLLGAGWHSSKDVYSAIHGNEHKMITPAFRARISELVKAGYLLSHKSKNKGIRRTSKHLPTSF